MRHPLKHTTMPTYRLASTQWWAGHDPYTYQRPCRLSLLPAGGLSLHAVQRAPFHGRRNSLARRHLRTLRLRAGAAERLFSRRETASAGKTFLILSLLAVPSAFASLRNAQFDLPLAALIVLTAAEIAAARWTAAAAWLCLAVALKPLAVVPLLLFGALYWKLIPRIAVGLLIVIALPFLHWNPAFVAHEYVRCFQTLAWASKGDEPRYSDLAALLSHFGYDAPDSLKTVVRVLFASIYLGLGAMAVRRLSRSEAAWAVGALSADYLMLFNPRTETCSYVFLGPFVASLALYYAVQPGRKWLACALGFAALGLACDAIPKIGAFSIHDLTDRWFKPLLALLFLPVLIQFILETRARKPSSPPKRNLARPALRLMLPMRRLFFILACSAPCSDMIFARCRARRDHSRRDRPEPTAPARQARHALRVDDHDRKFIFITPTGFKPGRPLPLVFFFHGAGGSAQQAVHTYGWARESRGGEFLRRAFPRACPSRPTDGSFVLNPHIWRDERAAYRPAASTTSISSRSLLDKLQAALPIDPQRIYVTGFSNGAGMTFTLGAHFSDRIAAIAPVSSQSFAHIDALARPLPVYYLTGTADPLIPYHGGDGRRCRGAMTPPHPPVQESVDTWAKLDGCPPQPQVVSDDNGVRVLRYGPGLDGV